MGQTISNRRKRGALSREARRRRGAAIILAAFLMGVLVSMLALAIDIGYIAASKAEARRTADAAALAGAWQMVDTAAQNGNTSTLLDGVNDAAKSMASLNLVCNSAPSSDPRARL